MLLLTFQQVVAPLSVRLAKRQSSRKLQQITLNFIYLFFIVIRKNLLRRMHAFIFQKKLVFLSCFAFSFVYQRINYLARYLDWFLGFLPTVSVFITEILKLLLCSILITAQHQSFKKHVFFSNNWSITFVCCFIFMIFDNTNVNIRNTLYNSFKISKTKLL